MLYTPLNRILNLAPLSLSQFFIAVGIAAVSVLWYEIVKIFNNMNLNKNS
jgi:Ca2+-transporting ATPase